MKQKKESKKKVIHCEHWVQNNKLPHRCPVCFGKGTVQSGFYSYGNLSKTSSIEEQCRACSGTGVLWG